MSNIPLEKILSDELKSGLKITLRSFRTEVAATLRWFESDEVKKTLDRSELETNLE